jgi:spore coat polysaccharide biosynthesis protein SpsF
MSQRDVLVVLQARMGSKRLPGKSLMAIEGQSLVSHCVTRLRRADVGVVLVATSTRAEDDPLAAEAARLDALVFRGDAEDVLDRVRSAAALMAPKFVVRATGDNPAVDPDSITRLLAVMRETPFDHAVEQGLPIGTTVEIMTIKALRAAAARATAPDDREHVTPFIRSAANDFRCAVVPAPGALCRPDLRFTVDTWTDLEYMRRVFRLCARRPHQHATLAQLIASADGIARVDGEVA